MNYLLIGNESYLIKKKMNEIIKEWAKDDLELSVVTYDASSSLFSISMLVEDASTIPFFTQNKILVVKNCTFLSTSGSLNEQDIKSLENYLNHPCETSVLIFVLENEKLDARKKIVKTIKKACREYKLDALQNDEFSSVLRNSLRQRNIYLDNDALNELETRLAGSLALMETELDRLMLVEKHLSKEDIELLVSRPLEDKAFDLVNAVLHGKMKPVYRMWKDLQVSKTDPILLNTLIGRQFHLIYQVKLLSKTGKSEQIMAQILWVHPYSVKLSHQNSRSISTKLLQQLIQDCAELDQKFKSGQIDRTLGFEHFLIHTAGRMNTCRL